MKQITGALEFICANVSELAYALEYVYTIFSRFTVPLSGIQHRSPSSQRPSFCLSHCNALLRQYPPLLAHSWWSRKIHDCTLIKCIYKNLYFLWNESHSPYFNIKSLQIKRNSINISTNWFRLPQCCWMHYPCRYISFYH